MVDALLGMEIASPDDLKPAIESVAETVGTIMNLMLGSGSDSGEDCSALSSLLLNIQGRPKTIQTTKLLLKMILVLISL